MIRFVVVCLTLACLFHPGGSVALAAGPAGEADNRPTPPDDAYVATAGQTLFIEAPGVLGNDADDGTLSATLSSTTKHGTLTLRPDGSFDYSPDSGFVGVDSFVYRGGSDPAAADEATVSIVVGTDPIYRCVKLVALSEVNGKKFTSAAEISLFDAQGRALDRTGWRVRSVDSEELIAQDGAATNAIDGDPKTIWHTQWKGENVSGPPHEIELDLGRPQTISRLEYLPRQDTSHLNGTIQKYEIHVSYDCTAWQLAARGLWPTSDDLKTAELGQTVERVALAGGIERDLVASNLYNLELDKLEGPFGRRYGGLAVLGEDAFVATGEGELFVVSKDKDYALTKLPITVPSNIATFLADFEARAPDGALKSSFGVKDILARAGGDGTIELFASYHHWDPDRHCGTLRVSRTRFRLPLRSRTVPSDWDLLFETTPCLPFKQNHIYPFAGHQSGGRLWLDGQDRMLLTVGDLEFDGENTEENYPQHPTASYGKTMEIDLRDKSARIFTSGHRNAQGLYVDPEGTIWSTEHGPKGGDELNILSRGVDYGWPTVTYGTDYDAMTWPLSKDQGSHEGFQRPFFAWVPSIGISNLIGVRQSLFALWRGDLLVASLGWKQLFRLRVREGRVLFSEPIDIGYRIRDLAEMDDGTIALKTDANGDPTRSYLIFIRPTRPDAIQEAQAEPATLYANPAKDGQVVALRCTGCHTLGQGGGDRIGPNLWNIVGQDIGSRPGFAYSSAMTKASGRWTTETLDRFLENPDGVIRGNKMQFAGIPDAEDRKSLIAYLTSLSPD